MIPPWWPSQRVWSVLNVWCDYRSLLQNYRSLLQNFSAKETYNLWSVLNVWCAWSVCGVSGVSGVY